MPTKIEWAEESWNPITGCSPVSEGCEHCYARRMAQRLKGRYGYPKDDPFKVTFHPDRLDQPLKWKKPRHIFVVSMGDLFHEDVSFQWIANVFGVMAFTQEHTFLILTKRPDRMYEFFSRFHNGEYESNLRWWENEACYHLPNDITHGIRLRPKPKSLPLPNVYLGVTGENQQRLDERVGVLLQIPAAKRFVSIEPMLGPTTLQGGGAGYLDRWYLKSDLGGWELDWVIAGCESGPKRRETKTEWLRDLKNQCVEADVPFFLKQSNGYINGKSQVVKMPILDGQEWNEVPD